MATVRIILDKRYAAKQGDALPLKIVIGLHRRAVMIGLGISVLPEQWDGTKIINHPKRTSLNAVLTQKRVSYEGALLRVSASRNLQNVSVEELRDLIHADLFPTDNAPAKATFMSQFHSFTESKKGRTREIYLATENRLRDFAGATIDGLLFDDITKDWLTDFDNFLSRSSPSPNARNIHLRNIRAVFNDAIDNDVTTAYPFRKFKIKGVPTVKRSLNIQQLRRLFNYKTNDYSDQYLDIFKLIFMLIGINIVDLCRLTEVRAGRLEYYRSKTHRLYSIKVEQEAQTIIERHKGVGYLLDILDRYGDYRDYARRLNNGLKHACEEMGLPVVTTYWARHSWATVAASLDIPKETIAAALGHGGYSVTDVYIDFDQRKVDEANRKVLDWVLYEKR